MVYVPHTSSRLTRFPADRTLVLGLLLGLLTMTLGASGSWAAPAAAAGTEQQGQSAPAALDHPQPAPHAPGRLIVFGIPGLTTDDIDPELTPNLYSLYSEGAGANLNVRTIGASTCPAAAWVSLGAGARAAAGQSSDPAVESSASCPPMVDPTIEGGQRSAAAGDAPSGEEDLTGRTGQIPDFDSVRAPNQGSGYAVDYGLLADQVSRSQSPDPDLESCVAAEGAGAAYAVADEEGMVRNYTDSAVTSSCRLSLIDIGAIGSDSWLNDPVPNYSYTVPVDVDRDVRIAAADRRLGEHLDALRQSRQNGSAQADAEPTIIVAGLGDSSAVPRLRAFILSGPGIEPGTVTSSTTRTPRLLQLTDLAPGILGIVGAPSPAGVSFDVTASSEDPEDRLDDLVTDATKAATIHGSLFTYSIVLDVLFYSLFILCGVLLTAAVIARRGGPRVHEFLAWTSMVFATLPMGAFLAGLFPWARFELPHLGLGISVVVGCALTLAVALLPPWGRTWRGRVAAMALFSVLVIAVDLATGSRLQGNSLLGYNPIVGGRFYGLGNQGAAVFIVSLFIFSGLAISWLRARGHARLVVIVPAVLGLAAVFVSGNPAWGAKFGGTIATLAGLLVLLALVTGIRLSFFRLVLIGLASLTVLLGIAYLDWLRPPGARSHFGSFFDQLVSGEALRVIQRKLGANLHIIEINPALSIITPVAIIAILFFLRYLRHFPQVAKHPGLTRFTDTWQGRLLEVFADRDVHFGFLAAATGLGVGLVLTDSGIAVPSTGAMVLLPYLLALSADTVDPRGGAATRRGGAGLTDDSSGLVDRR